MSRGARSRRQRGFASGVYAIVLLFLAAAAATAWVSMGIVTSERWPIRWLEVNGTFNRVSAEQLRASLSTEVGSNFFTVDLQGLQEAAMRIHWVSTARVQKQWPDTVRITVEEYVPVAHWNEGELIAGNGAVFAVPEADGIQGLPWLEGPDERLQEVLQTWVGLDEMLMPLGLEISRIALDGRGAWSLVLDNGTRVQLGRDETVERLERLLASWAPLTRAQQSAPLDIDLRYTNGFAVSWPPTADPATAKKM